MIEKARDFAERVLKPNAAAWEADEAIPGWALAEAGKLGFFGLEPHGLEYVGVLEEIARGNAAFHGVLSVHNSLARRAVAEFGTEEQKARYLAGLSSGECIGAYSLSEPGAGSDAGSIQTTAVADGDHFVINGTKCWVSNGGIAGLFVVFVSTNKASASRGMSAFLVEKGTPGFTVGRKELKMGLRASDTRELLFRDCRVPRSRLLGSLHGGFRIAMSLLDGGRVGIGAQGVGIAQAAFEEARARCDGSQLAQAKLADMAVAVDAARLLVRRAAALLARGEKCSAEASMAKLFATSAANRVVTDALALTGLDGGTAERLFRDARAGEIYEGTSEIQRLIIARDALRSA